MAGVRIKGAQIKKGGTKASQNATIVHCSEDVDEGDILCVAGMHGDVMSVEQAQKSIVGRVQLGPYYVADFKAKAGYIGPVAVDEKIVTADTTSHSVGGGLNLDSNGKFDPGLEGLITSSGQPALRIGPTLGRIIVVGDANNGKVLLKPALMENVFTSAIRFSSGSAVTALFPNTNSFNGAQVEAIIDSTMNPDNRRVVSAGITSGTLSITLDGSVTGNTLVRFSVYL
tara:strand:+ start:43 stop:726 length:684 start_codon:yes stop_codon:yes gene_type:complete